MKWLIFLAVAGAAYGLHRLALWMEARGWIYYVRKKASPNALGNAMLGVQEMLQPGAEHTREMRRTQRVARTGEGGPDGVGGPKPKY